METTAETSRKTGSSGGTRDGARQRPVTTPWGAATLVEEARVRQRVGDHRFASLLQLLELASGDQLVRIAYTTDGAVRRGPVTLRPRDIAKLREELESRPLLRQLLQELLDR